MEDRLFFDPPTAFAMTAKLERDGTWTLSVARSYEGRSWSDTHRDTYERLSLTELSQIVDGVLFAG